MRNILPHYILVISALFCSNITLASDEKTLQNDPGSWLSYGGNIHNTKYALGDTISPNNINRLKIKWVYNTTVRNNVAGIPEGVVATPPAVSDGILYFNSYSDGALLGLATNNAITRGAGILHAVNAKTGEVVWKKNYSEYSNCTATNPDPNCHDIEYSRNTPAIYGDYLVVGSQNDRFLQINPTTKANIGLNSPGLGAYVLIINKKNGELLHVVKIDDAPFASITQSPILDERSINHKKKVIAYASTSSLENADLSARPNYQCCRHRGSVVAIDVEKGQIIWQKSTVPGADFIPYAQRSANLYSGASSWGNTPVIDEKRGLLYITTGNNFNVPKPIDQCANQTLIGTANDLGGNALAGRVYDFSPNFETSCNHICIDPATGLEKTCAGEYLKEADNHPDSILALDLDTGKIKWSFSGSGKYDAMSVSCIYSTYVVPQQINQLFGGQIYNAANCDRLFKGPDNDFSAGVTLVEEVKIGGKKIDLILAGQKSGTFWAINADTQEVVWRRDVNTKFNIYGTSDLPVVLGGGSPWGLATDGKQVYVAEEMRKLVTPPVIFTLFPAALGIPSVTPFWGKPVISYNNNPLGLALNQMDPLDKAAPGSLTRSLSGYWLTLDIKNGDIVWQYAPPEREWLFIDENHNEIDDREEAGQTVLRAALQSGVVVSNGIVYGAAMDTRGTFRALDAKTGQELWKFSVLDYMVNVLGMPRTAVLVNTAPTIVNDSIYWGTGYSIKNYHVDARNLYQAGSNLLFAFELKK